MDMTIARQPLRKHLEAIGMPRWMVRAAGRHTHSHVDLGHRRPALSPSHGAVGAFDGSQRAHGEAKLPHKRQHVGVELEIALGEESLELESRDDAAGLEQCNRSIVAEVHCSHAPRLRSRG